MTENKHRPYNEHHTTYACIMINGDKQTSLYDVPTLRAFLFVTYALDKDFSSWEDDFPVNNENL